MQIDHLDHLVLTVSDLAETEDFYCRVLGMQAITFGGGVGRWLSVAKRSICTKPVESSSPRLSDPPRVLQTCALSSRHRWSR